MPINVGDISVSLTASTAQFQAEMSRAEQAANKATAGVQSSLAKLSGATSGLNNASGGAKRLTSDLHESNAALALVGEEFGVRIPRHIRTFISSLPGVSTAMSAAFSGLAIIGVVSVLVEAGKKVYELAEAFKKLQEGPKRVKEEFEKLVNPLKLTNDELAVTNDKLANDIAKLQGKPQNNLVLALDEARVFADKLAASIRTANEEEDKLLEKNSVGLLAGFFTGRANTKNTDAITKGFSTYNQDIADDAQEKLSTANPTDFKSIRAKENIRLQGALRDEIRKTNIELKSALAEQKAYDTDQDLTTSDAESQKDIIARLKGRKSLLLAQSNNVSALVREQELEDKKARLEAANVKNPYNNALTELDAQLKASKAALDAVGTSSDQQTAAKAAGEADKRIAAIRNETKAIDLLKEAKIRSTILQIEQTKQEEEWKKKLDNTKTSIDQRIKEQLALNAAIGQGAEAQKRAFVENKVLSTVGLENYNNPKWMSDHASLVAGIRDSAGKERSADQQGATGTATESIKNQITDAKNLASAEALGSEAIRKATEQNVLAAIQRKGTVEEMRGEIAAQKELFAVQDSNRIAATVAGINRQIEATKELTAAQWGGVEAIRAAEIAKIQNSGDAPQVIAAKVKEVTLQNQLSDIDKVRSLTHEKELEGLQDDLKLLEKAREKSTNKLAIDEAIKKVQQEILAIEGQQILASDKAMGGIKQAMRELSLETKTVAQEMKDVFKSAIGGINDQLTNLVTNQKTSWASFFRSISSDLMKFALQRAEKSIFDKLDTPERKSQVSTEPWDEKTGLPNAPAYKPGGILGKIFGGLFGGAGGKPDGSSAARALWVQMAGLPTNPGFNPPNYTGPFPAIPDAPQSSTAANVLGFISGVLGGASQAAGAVAATSGANGVDSAGRPSIMQRPIGVAESFPARAEGGDVNPGTTYEVGERGTELFAPRTSGMIIPHNQMFGGNAIHIGNIDCRGTDPLLVETRVRKAIALAHDSAVKRSGQVQNERARRTAQR